jgi:hypothetical protein
MPMTIETMLPLAVLSLVLMLAGREERRPTAAEISSGSRRLRRGRRAA